MLPLIIEPADLLPHLPRSTDASPSSDGHSGQRDDTLDKILIVDLCQAGSYVKGHIPGAVSVAPMELISGQAPAVGKLPDEQRLQDLLARIGYSPDLQIIAYDDEGGGWAGRFIWTLDVLGHKAGASYLNGGLPAWVAAGYAVSTELTPVRKPQSTPPNIIINTDFIATKDEVLASLDDSTTVIWDARSAEEYLGQKRYSQRGGHIPGAINFDWLLAMDPARQLRIRADIQTTLTNLGITSDKRIITHCQTHHRSGLTYLIGKHLGYDIRAYDGSWSEWGNDASLPVENS
jgi:thiosulfate/3-mercaptopyruvate sulfurtransferase